MKKIGYSITALGFLFLLSFMAIMFSFPIGYGDWVIANVTDKMFLSIFLVGLSLCTLGLFFVEYNTTDRFGNYSARKLCIPSILAAGLAIALQFA